MVGWLVVVGNKKKKKWKSQPKGKQTNNSTQSVKVVVNGSECCDVIVERMMTMGTN